MPAAFRENELLSQPVSAHQPCGVRDCGVRPLPKRPPSHDAHESSSFDTSIHPQGHPDINSQSSNGTLPSPARTREHPPPHPARVHCCVYFLSLLILGLVPAVGSAADAAPSATCSRFEGCPCRRKRLDRESLLQISVPRLWLSRST